MNLRFNDGLVSQPLEIVLFICGMLKRRLMTIKPDHLMPDLIDDEDIVAKPRQQEGKIELAQYLKHDQDTVRHAEAFDIPPFF